VKVRSNCIHSLFEEFDQGLSESGQLDNALRPLLNLEGVAVVDVHAHRDLDSIDNLLSFLFVESNRSNFVLEVISDIVAFGVTKVNKTGIYSVVVNDFGQLREVPCEPLLEAHREGVDVFVHLLNQGDSLGDGLVLTINVLSAL
jgi:hypothetical protein